MIRKIRLLSLVFCIACLIVGSVNVLPFVSATTSSSLSKKVVVYDEGELWGTSVIIQFGMDEQLRDIVNEKLEDNFHLENMEVKEFVNAYYLNVDNETSTSLGHDMIIKISLDERYLMCSDFKLYELDGNNVTELDVTRNDNFLIICDDHLSKYAVVGNVIQQNVGQVILIIEILICIALLVVGLYLWDKTKKERALLDYIRRCDSTEQGLNLF